MTPPALCIDGRSLSLGDVERIARDTTVRVDLCPHARQGVVAARAHVQRRIDAGETVYGVTTGFGHFAEVAIDASQVRALQINLVRSHAVGTGEPLSDAVVRALLLLRANVMARGCSGVRPEVIEQMLALLNGNVLPVVPRQGSVGASGDLAPLAHLALVLVGEGHARIDGRVVSGAEALAHVGVEALELRAKEGLALVNGTQVMTALGALASAELERLCSLANVAGALSLEALCGKSAPFDPAIAALRPHPGQAECADELRHLTRGSRLLDSVTSRVQDAYSLRCIPQVHGAALDACRAARTFLQTEVNSVTDNPLVLDDGRIVSCGNFHGQPVAYALDWVAMAAADLSSITERRVNRLLNPKLSGLPAFLVDDGGVRSGYLMTQTAAAAMVSETRLLAMPSSTDSIPTSADQEDHVSMGAWGGWKAQLAVTNARRVVAIELMCGAEALRFRSPVEPAPRLADAVAWIRERVAALDADRPLAVEIEALANDLADDALLVAVGLR